MGKEDVRENILDKDDNVCQDIKVTRKSEYDRKEKKRNLVLVI